MKTLLTKRYLIIVIAIVVVALGAAGWWYTSSQTINNEPQSSESAVQENRDVVTYTAIEGKTALDQLLELNDTVVTEESSYGTYVDSINGLKGGENDSYWSFYIDGKMAEVGAGAYRAKGGELIEWKYQ